MDDPTRRVKTTLAMERAFSGFPLPSGNPTFLGAQFLRQLSPLHNDERLRQRIFRRFASAS